MERRLVGSLRGRPPMSADHGRRSAGRWPEPGSPRGTLPRSLFTEYATIAALPVLTGDSRVAELARLWGLVYVGNLVGGFAFAAVGVLALPVLRTGGALPFGALARELVGSEWWVVLGSASLAGWLMGLLSWLVAGGRDTTSQFLFISLIGFVIGAMGMHHVITGGIEVLVAAVLEPGIGWREVGAFFGWTTFGNAHGGIAFAMLVRQGVQTQSRDGSRTDREEGRELRRLGRR